MLFVWEQKCSIIYVEGKYKDKSLAGGHRALLLFIQLVFWFLKKKSSYDILKSQKNFEKTQLLPFALCLYTLWRWYNMAFSCHIMITWFYQMFFKIENKGKSKNSTLCLQHCTKLWFLCCPTGKWALGEYNTWPRITECVWTSGLGYLFKTLRYQ